MPLKFDDKKQVFYVLTFNSTSFAIDGEKRIKKHLKIVVMPTPRELSASCGLAVKFLENTLEEITEFVKAMSIPCSLYSMTEEKIEGKRGVEKIFVVEE